MIQSLCVTTSCHGEETRTRREESGKGKSRVVKRYWLGSGTPTKNKKLVMESVIHKKASSLSQSVRQAHYLQRHTHTPIKGILYILFTHTETHSSTRTHSRVVREIMVDVISGNNYVDDDPST